MFPILLSINQVTFGVFLNFLAKERNLYKILNPEWCLQFGFYIGSFVLDMWVFLGSVSVIFLLQKFHHQSCKYRYGDFLSKVFIKKYFLIYIMPSNWQSCKLQLKVNLVINTKKTLESYKEDFWELLQFYLTAIKLWKHSIKWLRITIFIAAVAIYVSKASR